MWLSQIKSCLQILQTAFYFLYEKRLMEIIKGVGNNQHLLI